MCDLLCLFPKEVVPLVCWFSDDMGGKEKEEERIES